MEQITKLEKFKTAIFEEVETESYKIIEDAKQQKKSSLEKEEMNQLQKSYITIRQSTLDIVQKYRSELALCELNSKKEILKKRNAMIDKMFLSIEQNIKSFIMSTDYNDYLFKKLACFQSQNPLNDVIIFVSTKDYKLSDSLKQIYTLNCDIVEDSTILGGFKIQDNKQNLYFDETLSQKLIDQKNEFINTSKFALTIWE